MCNVPELMMCYHLNGIVQKYEKIKTAELPFLEGSQFSPKIVKDVAQNILSFLKSSCTKEGHTYWLFKSSKEDVVKLYDLTSIAAENQNRDPFASSVAFLLYRIAFNMYLSCEKTDHNVLKMVALLENCIKILGKEKGTELLVMANFLLSELYSQSLTTTSVIDVSKTSDSDFENDSSYATDDESTDSSDSMALHSSLDVKSLCEAATMKRKYEYVNKNLDEEQKCKNAIASIIQALRLLWDNTNAEKQMTSDNKASSPSKLLTVKKKFDESLLSLPDISEGKTVLKPYTSNGMKSKLLQVASKSYLTLARLSLRKEKLGRALRFLQIAFRLLIEIDKKNLCVQALMYYGDVITMLASKKSINIDSEKEEFFNLNRNDKELLACLGVSSKSCFCAVDIDHLEECFSGNYKELLTKALDVYEESLNNIESDSNDDVAEVS